MKTISKREIRKKVLVELRAARQFCSYDWGRYYKMMIDTSDADIWSDVFISTNEWKEYHSDTIHSLDAIPDRVNYMIKDYISHAIKLLKAAGWEIID